MIIRISAFGTTYTQKKDENRIRNQITISKKKRKRERGKERELNKHEQNKQT